MEERAVTTRLIRLTLSAIVLAQLAEAQSVAKPPLATQTQQRETETGSWRSGDAIIWIRVAPTGAIAVFASHGYRSAFAHAVYITPEDAERWADMGDHVVAGQPAPGVILADSELALEPARQGDSTVLTVRLGGVKPDGITFFMTSTAIRDISPMLRQTARTARANQAANASPSAAATPPAAPPAASAPAAAAPATPAPVAAVVAPQASAAIVAPPEVAAAGTSDAAPSPAPESIVPVSTTATPAVAANTATCAPVKTAATTPAKVAQVTNPTVSATKAKPTTQVAASSEMRRTSAGIIAKPAAATPTRDDVTDATKLSGSTVANLVKQWESQLDLCYSEYGLKVNPALTGSIAVRLAIRSSGEVAAATFTRHKWSGAGGTEAESCMRARAMAWMFPPASIPSAHEFTVAFAP
jgi:hypothetical protein